MELTAYFGSRVIMISANEFLPKRSLLSLLASDLSLLDFLQNLGL